MRLYHKLIVDYFPNAFECCVLNCDLSDCYDLHDKSTYHKELNPANGVLTTRQFPGERYLCGNFNRIISVLFFIRDLIRKITVQAYSQTYN